jgi:hypothetical protein
MKTKLFSALTLTSLLGASAVLATPVPPPTTTTSFGTLSGATFGGTGIPNTAVEIATIANGNDTLTLGLTATPKYPNPVVGLPLPNVGNTFTTTAGQGLSPAGFSTWNFDYYIGISQGGSLANYVFDLLVTGPGLASTLTLPLGTDYQDSSNIKYLGLDPNAGGQYSFELEAFQAGALVGTDTINVSVAAPDATSTVGLLALSLGGLALVRFAKVRGQNIA